MAVASGIGGALLAPAALLASGAPPAMQPAPASPGLAAQAPAPASAPAPRAALSVDPSKAVEGKAVKLDASGSTGAIVTYRWDLDGDGRFEADGGPSPTTQPILPAGEHRVGVRVEDAKGRTDEATAKVDVATQPSPAAATAPPAMRPAAPVTLTTKASRPAPAAPVAHERAKARPAAVAHAAGSASVTIQSFLFHPPTITIKAGDTVTWTNEDSTPHTATGNGGSFNTGVLKKGQSGSHTFSNPGRFGYICAIHPNMKGTVVVTAAATSSGSSAGGSSAGGSAAGSPSASSATGAGSSGLPHTGLELLTVTLVGLLLTGTGRLLRRIAGQSADAAR